LFLSVSRRHWNIDDFQPHNQFLIENKAVLL